MKEIEEEKSRSEVEEEIKEVRGVLSAIADFLKEIREPLKELLDTMLSFIKGSTLGEDVGSFYSKLVEKGIDPDKAMELTRKYLEARLSIITNLSELIARMGRREGKIGKKITEEGK